MKAERRSVFRDKAVRNYLEGRKAAVLPRLVSPSRLNLLWAVLGLFVLVSIGGAYFSRIPMYASGSHGASDQKTDGTRRNVEVIVSLSEHTPDLRVGQKLTMKADVDGRVMEASIVAVEPEVADPDDATGRPVPSRDLPSATGVSTAARPEAAPGGSHASLDEGSTLAQGSSDGRATPAGFTSATGQESEDGR